MKYILLIILYSVNLYSQSDSSIHNKCFLKSIDKGTYLSVGLVMSPSTAMLIMSDRNDKIGKYVYGTISVIGNLALITGTYMAFKEDHKLRNKFVHYMCMSIGGVCDGISEELLNHYYLVKEKFPNMNDNFFNPQISWNNKYKNGDINQGEAYLGSTSLFIAGTDGYHAFRAIKQTMWFCGLITFQKGKKFKHTLLQALISMAVYTTAKGTTHYILSH